MSDLFVQVTDSSVLEEVESVREGPYPPIEQAGPARWVDTSKPCTARRCGSPTCWRWRGVPQCSTHMIHRLNEMLVELGILQ